MKTTYIGWIVVATRYASMPRPRKCFVNDSQAVIVHRNFMPRRFLLMEKLFLLAEMPVHLLLKPNLNSNSWHKTNLPVNNASPAVANNRLYLRSDTHLYCIGE